MRVTNKMLSNTFLNDMNTNLQNMQTIQQQLSSGKEIRKPSDDPFKVARAMQLNTDISANTQYNSNIQDTSNWLDTTDTALGQAGNVLQRVRELLVSAGNAAYGSTELQSIKDEINQNIGQFAQTLNTSFDGKYLFAGSRGTTKPMETITNGAASVGAVSNSNSMGSSANVTGSFNGISDVTYQVKVTAVDGSGSVPSEGKITKVMYSTDGGNNWSSDVTVDASGNAAIGNGLTINIASNVKNKSGDIMTFAATAANSAASNSKTNSAVTASNSTGGAATISGVYTGNSTTSFKVKITSVDGSGKVTGASLSTDGGATYTSVGTITSNTIDLGNGLSINIPTNINNKANDTYSFTTTVTAGKGNTKLVYYSNDSAHPELTAGSNQYNQIASKLSTEVSQGVTMEYNVSASDVVNFKNESGADCDLRSIFTKIVNHLDGKTDDGSAVDTSANLKLANGDLSSITDAINNLLKVRSEVGAKSNRMETAKNVNEQQNSNMTEMLSKTEDIDITKKTMEYATAQTVYTAALQTSARILQPSLLDYLR